MKLNKLDNKLIKLTTTDDEIFEGICTYNSREYSYHEFGTDEECIQIINILFYKSYIKTIEVIDEFTTKYTKLEELIVEDGIDEILEVLEDEIERDRLINYIKDKKKELYNEVKERIQLDE